MSAKDSAIESLQHAKIAIEANIYLSKEEKDQLNKNIEYSMSSIPDTTCSSPEMVLAVSIMREAYLEAVRAMLLSTQKASKTA
jgi:hypothetical protein